MKKVELFLVGGAVREIVRGFPEKVNDWDFSVVTESFDSMRDWLQGEGFEIYLETPQYLTIRARAPKTGWSFAKMDMSGRTFDFVVARQESDYTDGRRPDNVSLGTIEQDLARRDFTINAMSMDQDGNIIDPFGGQKDLELKTIKCVGGVERLEEDSLRMLRALRFSIQLDFGMDYAITSFLSHPSSAGLISGISEDRVRDELTKCFKISTPETLSMLSKFPWLTAEIFDTDFDLWLMPTSKGK